MKKIGAPGRGRDESGARASNVRAGEKGLEAEDTHGTARAAHASVYPREIWPALLSPRRALSFVSRACVRERDVALSLSLEHAARARTRRKSQAAQSSTF